MNLILMYARFEGGEGARAVLARNVNYERLNYGRGLFRAFPEGFALILIGENNFSTQIELQDAIRLA